MKCSTRAVACADVEKDDVVDFILTYFCLVYELLTLLVLLIFFILISIMLVPGVPSTILSVMLAALVRVGEAELCLLPYFLRFSQLWFDWEQQSPAYYIDTKHELLRQYCKHTQGAARTVAARLFHHCWVCLLMLMFLVGIIVLSSLWTVFC